jgi:hypothetical protein
MRMYLKTKTIPHGFFTGLIKNKPEVYKVSEVLDKTRNIISFNWPATMCVQMVQTPVFKNRPINTDELLQFQTGPMATRSYNIQGYSPTNSFFEKLRRSMLEAPEKSQFLLFMSDNLWIADKYKDDVRWLSLDGSKMESSHNYDDTTAFIDFMKMQYEWDPEMLEFYTTSVQKMMVGAQGLLGSKTYVVDQLTSGFPETAGVNCVKMARIVS